MMSGWKVYLKVVRACRTPFVFCLDRQYRLLEVGDVMRLAKAFPPWHYVPEVNDCDDAAFAFRAFGGHGIGIALSRRHAWNIALCADGVWHVEPQNGIVSRNKWALAVII